MLFLGIDGGQSHIEVAIYINRKLIFNNTGGPTHIQGRSMEATFTEALQEALVGLPKSKLESIKAIGVGVSGFHIKGKNEAVIHSINSIFRDAKVNVVSYSEVALWGATEGKDGATVVAGTGSIAYGQYKQTTKMIGGYGFIFSDASGFWIGKEAIRLSLLSKDGREEETDLLPLVKNHFNVNNIKEVPSIIFSKESVDVAKIASL